MFEFIATGNELLDGSITDTNSKQIGQYLTTQGFKLHAITVVGDDLRGIQRAVQVAIKRSRWIFISGGLGPTTDDITLEAVAELIRRPMVWDKEAYTNITRRLSALGRKEVNPSNAKQAWVPKGATVLRNDRGTAPGVLIRHGKVTLVFLPGVPVEFQFIFEKHIVPMLRKIRGGQRKFTFIQSVFGMPESELNEVMKHVSCPSGVEVGYRAHFPEIHLKLRVPALTERRAKKVADQVFSQVRRKLPKPYALVALESSDQTFLLKMGQALLKEGETIALAESCTGGLATHLLSQVPGISKVLDRAWVTYSNAAKQKELGVSAKSLRKYGAVSEEVALEMARGALEKSSADKAISITGIAGPSGGTKEKPVGTVWVGVAQRKPKRERAFLLKLRGERKRIQTLSATQALRALLKKAN